ncbi:hypothetical protein SDC9_131498 [bioreactor metagenome]|uniref:Uncharacterized protein n=1 Tax=bioreactor metagenome TaxID=1076179 RepID=A0A645D4W8_9ZZZZ
MPETVREMAAGVQAHAHQPLVAERITQLVPVGLIEVVDGLRVVLLQSRTLDQVRQDRPVGDQVGVDAGMRLGVGVLGAEQFASVLGGHRLDGVDVLAACVEAVTDGSFGVFVRQPGAQTQQRRQRRVVLGRNELQRMPLVVQFSLDRLGDAWFGLTDKGQHCLVGGGGEGSRVGHGHSR